MLSLSKWKKSLYAVPCSFLVLTMLVGSSGQVVHAQSPTLDLVTDRDGDNVPDALAAAVNDVANAKDQTAAIQDLVSRMPFSEETRALQAKAEALQASITEKTDDATAEAIQKELQAVEAQMMADDPNYAAVSAALPKMFAPQLTQSSTGDMTTQRACFDETNCLKPGYIMLERDPFFLGNFLYAMWYSHAGNYFGGGQVYESNGDGVRLKPLARWQEPHLFVVVAKDKLVTETQAQLGVAWARSTYGDDGRTPYNYFFPDKWTNSRLYCSQLTWKIHKRLGVDLDSNHWMYQLWIALHWGTWAVPLISIPAVAPDEIALSSNVTILSGGWNFLP